MFVDLRGFGPGVPKQATDVLAEFLAALGVDRDDQPADADARAALYRTHTTGKRLLIVLDNAATADQVVPLLPGGTTCTVLVTSRHRLPTLLTRHGARPVTVDVLTDAESRSLLQDALPGPRTTAAEAAITELVALCGGFPLALGLIAARVRAHPDLLHDVVAELRDLGLGALDSDDPDASLPAVLSWSLRHLTGAQRTTFALLGLAPGPDTDLSAAACLTGLPAHEARAALRALADASLVTPAPGGRHVLHDLVRAYAATTAHDHIPEPARTAALERVIDFYVHTAHAADHILYPHRQPIRLDPPAPGVHPHPLPDHPAALAWLDAHHPHLLAAQHTAAAQHRHRTVWHLAWTLGTYHLRRGHRDDVLTVWQAAADAADHLPDPSARALAHLHLGNAHADLGRSEQAVTHLNQALALAEDRTQQAHIHDALGWVWAQQGDDRQAMSHARLSLDLFRTLGNPVWEARALNAVGWYAAQLDDHDTARDHCQAALALYRRHHDAEGEAATLDSLGYIDARNGRHDDAVDHYLRALTLYRTAGNATGAAEALDRLGQSHLAVGRADEARAMWLEALGQYREQGRDADADRVRQRLDDLGDAPR